jgi:hypothetical protein
VGTRTLSPNERREAIRATVAAEYAKGTTLPEVRRILAATLGGAPSLYLGTADPIYYYLAGIEEPLSDSKGNALLSPDGKIDARVLRSAVRRRRDRGVRWETLAASIVATLGRPVSTAEAKALYAKAGGDLDSSYVGRGTRIGAPATYADLAAAVESAAS